MNAGHQNNNISYLFEKRGMISKTDHQRINDLLDCNSLKTKIDSLEKKLRIFTRIESVHVPSSLITMNSEVQFDCLESGESHQVRLVYQFSPLFKDQVSVLAPLGTALLGQMERETVQYVGREGIKRNIYIKKIIFQPEAAGLLDL
jgi:regulator of nucleoside diphosphate kinase